MHRGWFNIISAPGGRPKITRALLMRVLDYAKPYRRQIVFMLLIIFNNFRVRFAISFNPAGFN